MDSWNLKTVSKLFTNLESGLHSPFEGQFPCEKRKVEEEGKVLKPLLWMGLVDIFFQRKF